MKLFYKREGGFEVGVSAEKPYVHSFISLDHPFPDQESYSIAFKGNKQVIKGKHNIFENEFNYLTIVSNNSMNLQIFTCFAQEPTIFGPVSH